MTTPLARLPVALRLGLGLGLGLVVGVGLGLALVLAPRLALAREPEAPFDNGVRGAVVTAAIGTTPVGDTLMGEIGGESAGLRAFDEGRWLLGWDAFLLARGGWLANQHPFLLLLGAHAGARVEEGYRFVHGRQWSPYLGGRVAGDVQLMGHPGLADSAFDTINSVDGVGGVDAEGTLRLAAGASLLDNTRSLLLALFAQELLQAPRTNTPGLAFTQIGIGARFDVARKVIAELDATWGVTPNRTDALRGITDQTTRLGVSASFRKIFGNGVWLGASLLLERDMDSVAYAGGVSYATGNAPTFGFQLLLGIPVVGRP